MLFYLNYVSKYVQGNKYVYHSHASEVSLAGVVRIRRYQPVSKYNTGKRVNDIRCTLKSNFRCFSNRWWHLRHNNVWVRVHTFDVRVLYMWIYKTKTELHTQTHTHTHTYIYIYIYKVWNPNGTRRSFTYITSPLIGCDIVQPQMETDLSSTHHGCSSPVHGPINKR